MSANQIQDKHGVSVREAPVSDSVLAAALRHGEDWAFEMLILHHHSALVRLAGVWVGDVSVAEEVAQETWLAVFQGIHAFEGTSPLKTWIFVILANRAKRRGMRDSRIRPFSAYQNRLNQNISSGPEVDPRLFYPSGHEWAGHWVYQIAEEESTPERHVLADEAGDFIMRQIDELPPQYRSVILLHDFHGFTTRETCQMLGITATNQRVILHRARSRLRLVLEPYLKGNDDEPRNV